MSDPLKDKKVVILGLGRQGMALAKWLCSVGAYVVVSDMRSAERLQSQMAELSDLPIEYELGGHPESLLVGTSMLCPSGGVPLDIPIIKAARKRGITLSNDSQIFMERCPGHVIGITGSAGKTTTTAMVGKILEADGKLPWVGGNIGNPLIDDLSYIRSKEYAVMELSSFQLDLMSSSPHIAAILNITPNHLDRHGTMESYIEAKSRILSNQIVGDVAVLGYDDRIASGLAGRVEAGISMFSARVPVDVGAWLVGDKLVCRPRFDLPMEPVCTADEFQLRGDHNILNALAACAIAGAAGASVSAMREAIINFKPIEHRLEVVAVVEGVTYINDSIATAPERVQAAISAYPQESLVLLLGGRDKNLPWDDLLREALRRSRAIITFGEAGMMIAEKTAEHRAVQGLGTSLEQVDSLQEAVTLAYEVAIPGDVVLLSPGGTSYDAYIDFAARGVAFRELVGGL